MHAVNIQLKDLNNKLEDKKCETGAGYSPRYSSIGSPNSSNNNGSPGVNTPITIQREQTGRPAHFVCWKTRNHSN